MRKIFIGLVSFAAVAGAFLLYSLVDKTPLIDTDTGTGLIGLADSNFGDFGDANEIGKIGDVGIGTTEKAYYVKRNEKNEIIGEFGFEVLLHSEGDIWELKKPYRNIYKPGFTCYMTADRGSVEVETAAGSTTPKDAAFSGNVVIHILPGKSGDVKESTIYLDDLVFLSDRSQLATGGPVTVVSEDFQMVGTGMELIYNDVLNRLELFRIFDLESLLIKLSRTVLSAQRPADDSTDSDIEVTTLSNVEVTTLQPDETADAGDSQEPEQEENQYYKCLFSKNVLIDTPEELIFAAREVLINDIFWSEDSTAKNTAADTSSDSDANAPVLAVTDSNEPNEPDLAFTDTGEPNEPSEQLFEVTITCDNGITIAPRDLAVEPEDFTGAALDDESIVLAQDILDKAAGRTTLMTKRIDYNAPIGDALATGLTELTFYTEDSNISDPNQNVFPVKVTAQKKARFLKTANQVIFEGDCLCTMPQKDLTSEKNITLSSPELTINLPESKSEQTSTLPDMTAAGPAELIFYVEDSNAAMAGGTAVPIKITAQKQARFLSELDQVIFEGECLCKMGSEQISKDQNFQLKSPMLTVNLPKEKSEQSFALTDIIAAGPAELDFYVDDMTGAQAPNEPLPAKVTAQKQARFLSSTEQVIFEGSCRSTILREDPNYLEEFTLLSEKMTVDLPKDANDRLAATAAGVKHLTAEGGVVTLAAIKKAKADTIQAQDRESERKLSGIEIKCSRIDYSSEQQLFLATGPALVKLNNTEIKDPNEQGGQFGLGKYWWAVVEDCNNLKYLPKENQIIADAEPDKTLIIKYITVEDGQYGPVILATAGHVDIKLMETADGQTELSTLFASGGIDYKDNGNRFLGSELFFNHEQSLITVTGDQTQPCYFNGSLVDGIKYDLKTRNVEAQVVGPGALKIKR